MVTPLSTLTGALMPAETLVMVVMLPVKITTGDPILAWHAGAAWVFTFSLYPYVYLLARTALGEPRNTDVQERDGAPHLVDLDTNRSHPL